MNTSNNVEVIQTYHENFFDLESFLNDLYNITDTETVKINNLFQVKKKSSHIGYHQEFHDKVESNHNYKKENAYDGAQRKRISRNIFKYVNQLEKPKFRVEKRFTLLKFRPFVVPEDQ